ncbi:MAG TPA: DNA polymerase III subunit delta [Candidatus Peribacteraceae bacterium]|nr:DNA polymerase III subunit delta [Candidatus Peribacteraceae bacterium]
MSQIYLFTGENACQLREEKMRWMKQFTEKHGAENLMRLDGSGLTFREFLDEVSVAPFLAEKRLVLVSGVPKFSKEEMQSLSYHIHPSCLVVFVDPSPDKRLSGVKELQKVAEVKEFLPLKGGALDAWMMTLLKSLKATISSDAKQELLASVGEDQEMLKQEIEKLALFTNGREITIEDVQMLVIPSGEEEIWTLMNLIAAGKEKQGVLFAKTLIERGTAPHSLWGMLLWMLENVTLVSCAVQERQTNPAKIAQMGVPFPSVRTLMPLASKVSLEGLKSVLACAVASDIELKTGGYRATAEAPEELHALIDRFILNCGRLTK